MENPEIMDGDGIRPVDSHFRHIAKILRVRKNAIHWNCITYWHQILSVHDLAGINGILARP